MNNSPGRDEVDYSLLAERPPSKLERDRSTTTSFAAMAMVKGIAKLPLALDVLFAALAFSGCSMKLEVALFNNTGKVMTVRAGSKALALEPGRSIEFDYPGQGQTWTFRLATAECDFVYQVPRSLEHYPWSPGSNGPLKAQVEADFSIYLLPPAVNEIGAVAGYAPLQQDGFPLRPISKSCRSHQ